MQLQKCNYNNGTCVVTFCPIGAFIKQSYVQVCLIKAPMGPKHRDILCAIIVMAFCKCIVIISLIKQYRETTRGHESGPVFTYRVV